ncbi:MAG: biotin/lipoyl-containing protein [Candidatus Thorarchaeota archaeon]
MSREYQIQIDDRPYTAEVKMLDEGGVLVVKVGDTSFTVKATKTEDGVWVANDTSTDYTVRILRRSGRRLVLEINGEEREIEWERVRRQEVASSAAAADAGGKRVLGGIYPPMPGKITEVRVSVGDTVKVGDTVLILEAMKMFNELKTDVAGTVKELNVSVGSPVTTNDLLILIE